MTGPAEGLRVVELGAWIAAPAAGAILADWGADVVKIEGANGDPLRFFLAAVGLEPNSNPLFQLDNRGKRSVALDLKTQRGKELANELIEGADVFLTNFRVPVLRQFGLDYETLAERNPRLVYSLVTGYGLKGADKDRASFDLGAFWSRSGIAASLTRYGQDPPYQRPGMGDHTTGLATLAGIMGALFDRERTGRGQLVSTSLLRTGLYFVGSDLNFALRSGGGAIPKVRGRNAAANPLVGYYQDKEGRFFCLLGVQGDRHWPDIARAIGRIDLIDDERFSSFRSRAENVKEASELLSAAFVTKTLAEWDPIFAREDVWWSPVREIEELLTDPQVSAAGGFVEVPTGEGSGTSTMVASPIDFSESAWSPSRPSPEIGQHTEEVLLDLGYDWEGIAALQEGGAIP